MQVAEDRGHEARPASLRFRGWCLLAALAAAWLGDSLIRGGLADKALARAGYAERTSRRNLWPKHCGMLAYEAVFWGQGPRAREAQGYVCIRYLRAPVLREVGWDEHLGLDSHP